MRSAIIFFILVLLPFVGCSNTADTNASTGAVAGGVVGAGLGAIIGSATGDAGAGLAIGAAAGSATGAVLGNKVATQNETIRTQDEAIERQDRMIAAHKSEIEELKRLSGDSVTFHKNSGAVGVDAALVARRYKAFAEESKRRAERAEQNRVETRTTERTIALIPQHKEVAQQPSEIAERELVQDSGLLEIKKEQPVDVRGTYDWEKSSTTVARTAPKVMEDPSEMDPQPKIPEDSAAKIVDELTAEPEKVANSGDSAECKQAEEEVTQAKLSAEASDKLFHYRRALRLCPDNAGNHNGLGEVYLSLGRKVDAEFEFQQALKVEPGFALAEENLSKVR